MKDIINLIYWLKANPSLCSQYYRDRYDGILTWLEKQKEQKPAEYGVDVIKTSALLAADRLASAEMTGRLKERSEILDNPTKYGLQKPAEWSEEDERNIRNLESVLYYDKYLSDETRTELGNFLKSLPERFNLQPKQEWSEEEYGRLFDIEHYLDGTLQLSPDRRIACIDFLKSLRSQSRWKPSKEQMKALIDCTIGNEYDVHALVRLWAELKKL